MESITTRIVGKFQVTVPPEIREIFGLKVGDLLEWTLDRKSGSINLIAKRAQLITPRIEELERGLEARHSKTEEPGGSGTQNVAAI
jgi:bifunctional DNA-binding transcriptional regulator/antitoxin component of YhaV-PrlF toxin-antitoxin module